MANMKEESRYLPQHCWSQKKITPEAIVIHYISAINTAPADPYNPDEIIDILVEYGFSAHMLVGRDDDVGVIRLVPMYPTPHKAYHAGRSDYAGRKHWNNFSIGIELIGTATSGFTDYQYDTCAWLVQYYMEFYDIPWEMVVGHETIAPDRKVDPGIATGNFDMERIKPVEWWG